MTKTISRVATGVLLVAALAACGSNDEPTTEAQPTTEPAATTAPAATTTPTATTTPAATTPLAVTPEAVPAPEIVTSLPDVAPVLMPPVVCMNLQAAQNLIQDAGVFFSRSEDATGAGRLQVNDSNWIVVDQVPGVGVPISEGDAVLSVVKIGEPNNC